LLHITEAVEVNYAGSDSWYIAHITAINKVIIKSVRVIFVVLINPKNLEKSGESLTIFTVKYDDGSEEDVERTSIRPIVKKTLDEITSTVERENNLGGNFSSVDSTSTNESIILSDFAAMSDENDSRLKKYIILESFANLITGNEKEKGMKNV
jgi:hypothetical protein